MSASRPSENPPKRIGAYTLGEAIASGGTGSVYRATRDDGLAVALKLFDVRLEKAGTIARFEKEAKIRLDHPNIVQVLDAGTERGTPFLVLELLEGRPLADVLSEGTMSPQDVVDLGVAVCQGLEVAHAAGVVHRDLKPENLFVTRDGTVKILDFGIALLDTDPERITTTGMVVGTPWYLSPEQASGTQKLDHRTDIWSLGAVLYECLAGETPFEYQGMLQTVLAILREELTPLRAVAPRVPPPLAVVIERCLVKNPRFRWSSADKLKRALLELDPDEVAGTGEFPVTRPSIAVGERRLVAVLFAEGVTDGEALRHAVEKRRGQYLPLYAKRAVGLFGGEAWEGDELGRAVEAALEARDAVSSMVVAAGHATGHGAGISGEALAHAERGANLNAAGVVIDERSAKLLGEGFATYTLGNGFLEVGAPRRPTPIAPRAPVTERAGAYRDSLLPPVPDVVADALAPKLVEPAVAPPFVGRQMELAQIDHALREVFEGRRASAVMVVGPTGIGKSRLREEMQARLAEREESATVLFARGDTLGKSSAFSLMGAALRRHARIVTEGARIDPEAPIDERREAVRALTESAIADPLRIEETAPFLGELLAVDFGDAPGLAAARSDPRVMADRIRLAVRDFFAGLSAKGPLALALEDIQWSDDATLDVVEELVDYLRDTPFLVFLTARPWIDEARPEYLKSQGVLRIEPRPLLRADVAEMANALARRPLDDALIDRVTERCGGNPLFVEQTIAELLSRDFDQGTEKDLPLPLTVEAAVQSRLDHLPPLEKTLCRYASVLGRPFSVDELEELGVPDAAILLESLARRGIVSARAAERVGKARQYRFRVGIVGEVAYAMLARDQRAELHRRAAEVLEYLGEASPEELAVHFDKGGERGKAADKYAAAALEASRKGDVKGVEAWSEKALAFGVREGTRFELRMARANALTFRGLVPEALRELEDAMECAQSDREKARVHSERGHDYLVSGKSEEAIEELAWAVALGEKGRDAETVVRALLRRATVRVTRGELGAAEKDVVDAEHAAPSGSPLAGWVMELRGYLASTQGRFSEEEQFHRSALTLHENNGDLQRAARARANLADVYNKLCAFDEAAPALRRAIEDCQRVGNRVSEGWATLNLGITMTGVGSWEEAGQLLQAARSIGRDAPNVSLEASALLCLARLRLRRAQWSDAIAAAEAARELAEAHGLKARVAATFAVLSAASLARSDVKAAVDLAARGIALRDEVGGLDDGETELYLAHGRALAAAGRHDEARDAFERGRQIVADHTLGISSEAARDRFLAAPINRALMEAS